MLAVSKRYGDREGSGAPGDADAGAGPLPEPLAAGYDRLIRPFGFLILIVLMLPGLLYELIGPPLSLLMGWLLP